MRPTMVSMILAAVAILFPGQALSAGELSLEALVGVGYSVTDIEKWSGEAHKSPLKSAGSISCYPLNTAFDLDLGAGLVMFEDFTDFSLSGALAHQVPLSEGLYLPISVRGGIILEDPMIVPIGVCIGIRKVL